MSKLWMKQFYPQPITQANSYSKYYFTTSRLLHTLVLLKDSIYSLLKYIYLFLLILISLCYFLCWTGSLLMEIILNRLKTLTFYLISNQVVFGILNFNKFKILNTST
ncbi:hypothetical protein CONCODRAFT_77238 [Conidiobolus coronatus NRRL 28638]|uniref:Uncharacterized protein n=1 Tax=Conidiobolus coronatus (strain ATCC 28846 / CBS 209.66 / NRRL 28638) TaxID=796925 RepID=A0A137PFF2_CONC2|nr:hypothetical protein CONCODRAFT_77238 [Conidiobolus coronatus NRRL 28638]|eukprot:KXN73661.1 hypothetical protein CONCODRAFT_77238 [Conidiobolus coronatus NRRL 28638]